MSQPLVSIITPAYNCSKVISETIESVLSQEYENWEMIIVNDASTDNTQKIIEKYTNLDARIKLYKLEINSGSATAKNYAIKKSHGKYIAFLDADDLWEKKKLKIQIEYMEMTRCAFSFTAYEFFSKSTDLIRKYIKVPKLITYKKYLSNTIIGNSTVIMNKDIIGNIEIKNGYLEDVLTWMFYLKKGFNAYGINNVLMSYRVYKESKSGKKLKNSKRYYRCLRKDQNFSIVKSIYFWFRYALNASKKRVFAKKRKIRELQ